MAHSFPLFLLCEEQSSHKSHEMVFSLGDDSLYQVITLHLLHGWVFLWGGLGGTAVPCP